LGHLSLTFKNKVHVKQKVQTNIYRSLQNVTATMLKPQKSSWVYKCSLVSGKIKRMEKEKNGGVRAFVAVTEYRFGLLPHSC